MSLTVEQIDAIIADLEQAYASGAQKIRIDDHEVTYNSPEKLLAAIGRYQRLRATAIGNTGGGARKRFAQVSKGV